MERTKSNHTEIHAKLKQTTRQKSGCAFVDEQIGNKESEFGERSCNWKFRDQKINKVEIEERTGRSKRSKPNFPEQKLRRNGDTAKKSGERIFWSFAGFWLDFAETFDDTSQDVHGIAKHNLKFDFLRHFQFRRAAMSTAAK